MEDFGLYVSQLWIWGILLQEWWNQGFLCWQRQDRGFFVSGGGRMEDFLCQAAAASRHKNPAG